MYFPFHRAVKIWGWLKTGLQVQYTVFDFPLGILASIFVKKYTTVKNIFT